MLKCQKIPVKSVLKNRKYQKFIYKQRTLIATLVRLMEGQNLLLVIVRIVNKNGIEKTVPFGLKVNKELIPENCKPLKIHPNNLLTIQIDGCEKLKAMLVAIGEDSKDLMENYKIFIDKYETHTKKIAPCERKIVHWCNLESVKIQQSTETNLKVTSLENFESLLRRIDRLKRRHPPKCSSDSVFPKVDSAIINVESGESTSVSSNSEDSDYDDSDGKTNRRSKKINQSAKSTPNHSISKSLEKIRMIANQPQSDQNIKEFFQESSNIFQYMVKLSENFQHFEFYQPFSTESESLRFISESDETKELDSKVTLVEGILPLPTRKYKCALKLKNPISKLDEFESGPAAIMSNIIRFAFPRHWLDDVTLRGSGGRISLISIWNRIDPLIENSSEPIEIGLGEKRFRALLDHSVRKAGKKSYDRNTEKNLVTTLSKAMHYARTKLPPAKKGSKEFVEEQNESRSYDSNSFWNFADISDESQESLDYENRKSINPKRIRDKELKDGRAKKSGDEKEKDMRCGKEKESGDGKETESGDGKVKESGDEKVKESERGKEKKSRVEVKDNQVEQEENEKEKKIEEEAEAEEKPENNFKSAIEDDKDKIDDDASTIGNNRDESQDSMLKDKFDSDDGSKSNSTVYTVKNPCFGKVISPSTSFNDSGNFSIIDYSTPVKSPSNSTLYSPMKNSITKREIESQNETSGTPKKPRLSATRESSIPEIPSSQPVTGLGIFMTEEERNLLKLIREKNLVEKFFQAAKTNDSEENKDL